MFTGRSEFRLTLRPDNADLRLTEKGHAIGCVLQERYNKFKTFRDKYNTTIEYLQSVTKSSHYWKTNLPILPFGCNKPTYKSLFELLQFGEVDFDVIKGFIEPEFAFCLEDAKLMERVKIQSVYNVDELKQYDDIEEIRKHEAIRLPYDFDYNQLNLSFESKEKLMALRPTSLGQAIRIQGMSASTIFKLFNFFKGKKKDLSVNI